MDINSDNGEMHIGQTINCVLSHTNVFTTVIKEDCLFRVEWNALYVFKGVNTFNKTCWIEHKVCLPDNDTLMNLHKTTQFCTNEHCAKWVLFFLKLYL